MKITVVGIGKVGSTVAFVLAKDGLAQELVLYNRTRDRARADAIDVQQAVAFVPHRVDVRDGDLDTTAGSDVIVLCVGVHMPAECTDRTTVAEGNTRLIRDLVPPLLERSPNAIIVNVTNPMDAITHHLLTLTGLPWQRVIGTGTLIDSARFRELLGEQLGIHPVDLNAYILGEHGDSQFAALSVARCGGEPIDATPSRQKMIDLAKQSAWDVYRVKGYTNYAVAMAAHMIVEAIVKDLRTTMPVSVKIDGYCGVTGVCLSVPCVIGRQGVHLRLQPALDEREQGLFRASAEVVRGVIERTKGML
ncbi:MAG: NAD(P)-binding domain-containing protein [Tepidisphaeraceae bacterium]